MICKWWTGQFVHDRGLGRCAPLCAPLVSFMLLRVIFWHYLPTPLKLGDK